MSGFPKVPAAVKLLVAVVMAGQVVALADSGLRPEVVGSLLLLLSTVGIVSSLKAARTPTILSTWHLIALSQMFSLAGVSCCAALAWGGGVGWLWACAASSMAMFGCLSAVAIAAPISRLRDAQRWGLVAEVTTVFFSGLMITWYFVLAPAFRQQATWPLLELGIAASELLALAAVTAALLRSAATQLTQPLTVLFIGAGIYGIGFFGFFRAHVPGLQAPHSAPGCAALITGSLLMAVAAMLASSPSEPAASDHPRVAQAPLWATILPYLAVGIGNVLMLVVAFRLRAWTQWGGLAVIQVAMTTALAVRQLMSLRESSRLGVTDSLTGLTNLSGLQDALQRSLHGRGRPAVMLLDLDGFKDVNDRYGHATGDRLLIEFSRLLRDATRRGDIAARVGGDEFVLVLEDVTHDGQAVAVAERLLAALAANPVAVGDDVITMRVSIGVATLRAGDTVEGLKHRADVAMYEAKRAASHGWRLWNASMNDRRARDAELSDALQQAVGSDQFSVVYQPIVELGTHRPVGGEALLRWQHPTLGQVSPVEFIPIAERAGVIHQLCLSVLRETCEQFRRWRTQHADLHAAVNISAIQLREPSFLQDVLGVLDETGLPAHALMLEVTESAIVDEDTAVPVLEQLREHGIRVAIDDFGTGYSSLHQLTQLPVDVLKIDRSFVAKLDSTARGAAVAEAIIRLARVLDMSTLAEGVETAGQAAELQLLGCPLAQGYLFAKPLSAEQVSAFLATASSGSAEMVSDSSAPHQ